MEFINNTNGPAPIGHYTDAIRSGNILYMTGQGPFDAQGRLAGSGIREQTRQAMENLASLLGSMGLGMKNVLAATVFLTNWDDFPAYNEVYKEFMGDHKPVRTTVEVSRLAEGALIEMQFTAEIA